MYRPFRTLVACATLVTAFVPFSVSAAESAMKGDAMSEVPCAKAATMMSAMHGDAMHGDAMKGDAMKGGAMHGDAMKSGGETSVDAAFAHTTSAEAKSLMAMAKLEMRCGSDPKTKAAAERSLFDLTRIVDTLSIF